MKERINYRIPAENHKDVLRLTQRLHEEDWIRYEPIFRSSFHVEVEYSLDMNYIRTDRVRQWQQTDIDSLLDLIQEINQTTDEYDFHIKSFDDYEVEWDGDRSYPASFTLLTAKKNQLLKTKIIQHAN
jgi:hypothetical protein